MFKDLGTLFLYMSGIVFPFVAIYVYRQKMLHGIKDATHFCCKQGFHQLQAQKLKDNNYLGRKQCVLCGYIPKDQ